jgi:anthranilate synthase/aminodeoxychorismate synthase-like glutamine amidotransferase
MVTNPARVLLLDNLDSFTHNVAQALVEAGARVEVRRKDRLALEDIAAAAPDLLVLSPGPGVPEDAALALAAVRAFQGRIPILGVCLGHQVLACAFGGTVGRAPEPVHGKAWTVRHDGRGLFQGLADPMEVGRYHSLVVTGMPAALEVTARTPEGLVMALRHRELPLAGVQFHPDSFLTPLGVELFRNAILGRF